jgi:hemolysin activation/secretion protein
VDVEYHPRRGASFDVKTDYLTNLDDNEITKTSLMTSLALYFPIGSREKLVSAHKIGTGINFSDDHLFYHAQQLGGTSNLRGFRNERFTGNSSLYYNTDLRLELASIQGHTMSSEIGIYAGFDIGRVWWEDEDKDRWHTDYGGGIWIAPFKMAIVRAGYFLTEDEGGRLTVGVGFEF